MKTKYYLWILFILSMGGIQVTAQELKPFTLANQTNGSNADILLIGNNNLSINKTTAYNGSEVNQNASMIQVDIDTDNTTTNSSSANLSIPTAYRSCYKIKYAALYWAATYEGTNRAEINKVKLKLPGSSNYQTITGTVIHDVNNISFNSPYAAYADVTALINATNAEGTYTVADIKVTEGRVSPGYSAGWHLYVIYENPTLPARNITSFNGFANIDGTSEVAVNISGFQTIPVGPVTAKVAFAALEGDQGIRSDYYLINDFLMRPPSRAGEWFRPNIFTAWAYYDNFFNSKITDTNGEFTNRNPASTNTLGYDAGIFNVVNTNNAVIKNGDTSATIKLGTGGDVYYQYFNAFAVDVIAPKIVLTKSIETPAGTPISAGSSLNLGQTLDYVISFQNTGNDDATNVTIRDILPVNTIFTYPTGLILPAGVTVASYNSTTRQLVLNINNSLVRAGGSKYTFRIRVRVVENCYDLVDACENRINNQAFVSYRGVTNTNQITDDPSFATFNACAVNSPSPTNFIGNIDDCRFSQNVFMCGTSTQINAPGGYTTYTWSGPSGSTITPVVGTNNQSVTVNLPGNYTVLCNAPDPCVDVPITYTVTQAGQGLINPVTTFLQGLPSNSSINYDIKTCPDGGLDPQLPYLYLCGTTDTVPIVTNIAGALSIRWDKLDTNSCPSVTNSSCANTNITCNWVNQAVGANYTVTSAGQYRVVVTFPGGCDRTFYFNASLEFLDPQATTRDIVCTTPGSIIINNVPATGYEFSISSPTGIATNVWQASNQFNNINLPGNYTVFIRKVGFPGGCLFQVSNLGIRIRNFTVVPTYTEPLCSGNKGSIRLAVNDVFPNYNFEIFTGSTATGTPVDQSGPISLTNDYTFSNLSAGQQYTWKVTTSDGCTTTGTHTFSNPPLLTVTASITRPLTTCSNGEITINAVGGTPPYTFIINGTSQGANNIVTTITSGTYNIQVNDSKNCSASTSQTINLIPAPVVTATPTHILCATSPNSGVITFTTVSTSGQNLEYSINGGSTYSTSATITGLSAGDYVTVVKYTTNGITCTLPPVTVRIIAATAITGSASVTTPLRCGAGNGATITAVMNLTGAGGLQFNIGQGWVTTQDFTNLPAGTYTIQVRDLRGCTISLPPVTISPLSGPTDLILVGQVRPTSCTATGSINVNIAGTGGQSPIRYRIVSPASAVTPFQSSGNFGNLSAGTYTFEVIDANDCSYREDFTLASLPAPVISGQLVNDVVCFGTKTGNGMFSISGLPNNVRYFYRIINVATGEQISTTLPGTPRTPSSGSTLLTIPFNNVEAGTYEILFISSDYDNCTYTSTVTISGPTQALAAPFTFTNPTCSVNGSITVNPTGGWGGYTYAISPNAGVTVSGNVFSNLLPNVNYTITVTDAKGCQATISRSFTAPPAISANVTGDYCYDGTNAATLIVNVLTGTAPYQYSINGGLPQASNTFPNLIPGNYEITVQDANNCSVTLSNNIIAPQLTISVGIQKEITCSTPTAAVVSGAVSGGSSPTVSVSYNGNPATTGVTFPYTASLPGTYVFTAADANCSVTSATITISAPTNPTATHTVTDVLCNGGNNGAVSIVPSGGVGPYQINFNSLGFSTNTTYPNLTAGSYPYIVRDSKGCTFNGTAHINQPSLLTASHNVTPFSCNASNTAVPATITVTASNGTPNYQYSFNGGLFTTSNTFVVNDNGTNQTITYVVKDANGCTYTSNVLLQRLNPPVITSVSTSTITCAATTATIQMNVSNGVPPLTYAITAPVNQTNATGNFSNLNPGTYTVQVTDANGCFATSNVTISPVTPITINGNKLSDVLCNGGNTGAAVFTIAGFTTNYNYSLNGSAAVPNKTDNTISLNNLIAGTYTIVVVDPTTNCTATDTVIIGQPATALTATASTTNVNCKNDISTITVTANGGTAPYTYAAVTSGSPAPASTTYTTTNPLSVDTNNGANLSWDVYVKDANGCIFKRTVTVIMDNLPTVTVPALAANQCSVPTGFSFTATGTGINPLSYSIDGVIFQSSPTFTVNTPGTYTVTIKDGNGCTATSPTTITIYAPLAATTAFLNDLMCTAPTNGNMSLTVTGGRTPYRYQLLLNGAPTGGVVNMVGSTVTIPASIPGNYTVTVTDFNNCTFTTTNVIPLTPAVPPTVATVTKDPTCNNGTDGTVTLNATGGTAPYQYIFNGSPISTSNIFGGLSAGTYNYTVTDARGCTANGTVTINNPAPIVVNLSKTGIVCNLNNLGSFDVTIVSGATAPFTYNLLDSSFGLQNTSGLTVAANHSFTGLNFGDYYIQVIDAKGCVYLSPRQRIETQPTLTLTSAIDSNNCATGVDVTVTTSGGASPYDYSIVGQPDLITNTNSNTFLYGGLFHNTTYYLQVRDVNNCVSILEFTTPAAPSTINITSVTTTNVSCNGAANGSISFTVQNFDPTVTSINYTLVDAITNLPVVPAVNGVLVGPAGGPVTTTLNSLPPGNYNIRVSEATGTLCSANYNFQITQPSQPLSATITGNINANCIKGAQVTVTATGGTPNYTYAFVVDGVAPIATDYVTSNLGVLNPAISLNWDIWIKDANGCTTKIDHSIVRDADPTINPITQQCFVGTPLNFTVSGTAFNGNLTYGINSVNVQPVTFQNSPNFTVSAAGTYYFFVKDDNNCVASTSVVVAPQLLVQAVLAQDLTCLVDATINIQATQGTAPYVSYGVSTNPTGPFAPVGGTIFTTNTAATYYFEVTDTQGCKAVSNPVIVTPRTNPTFTYVKSDVSCNGGNNGTITITASNGIQPYTYSRDNGVTYQPSNFFSGLPAGTYQVSIKDAKDCVSPVQVVVINEPTVVTASLTLTNGLTCGAANSTQAALLTASGSGGTAPYMFSFNGSNYSSTATYQTLNSGLVTVSVRDANGCISPVTATINVPVLTPPTDMAFSSTAVTCIATTSTVTITSVTDGTGPYTYSIIAPIVVAPQLSNVFGGLTPNNYLFQVTDANGCTTAKYYNVAPVNAIVATPQILSNVSCTGGNNGSIRVFVNNFAGTYNYTVNAGAPIIGKNATYFDLTLLTAGNYTIVVTDDITGCASTINVPISQPNALTLNVVSNTNANCNDLGIVTVQASNGTPNYTYAAVVSGNPAPALASYSNVATFNLPAGNWDIYVRDNNGCIINTPLTVTVLLDTNPRVTLPGVAANQCTSNGTTYTFTAIATPGFGVAPYTFSIDGFSFANSGNFTVTAPGLYTVTIKDANDCLGTGTIRIYPPVNLSVALTADADCAPLNSGEITVTPSGGSGNYTYELIAPSPIIRPVQASPIFSNLNPGTYTVQINDTFVNPVTGTNEVCSKTAIIDILVPQAISFTTSTTDVSCFGGSNGTINVTTMSGDLPLTYQITAGSNPAVTYPVAILGSNFSNLPAGSYTVTASNARNCSVSVSNIVINQPMALVASANFNRYTCSPANSVLPATITVTATGGSAPYSYSKDGVNYFSSNIFAITDTGSAQTFTLWVRDTNGCIDATDIPLTIPAYVPIVASVDPVITKITCRDPERIAINVISGTGPYLYSYIAPVPPIATVIAGTGALSNQFSISAPGHYTFQVTDTATGCTTMVEHDVMPYNTIQATLNFGSNVSCLGGTDGTMTLSIQNYSTNYTYTVYDVSTNAPVSGLLTNVPAITTANTTITGLPAGTYYVIIQALDTPFCPFTTGTISIGSPTPLVITNIVESANVSCSNNQGAITVSATGGTGTLSYQLSSGAIVLVPFGNSPVFNGLSAGNYTITVRDTNNCIQTGTITLVSPSTISAIVNDINLDCFNDTNGQIVVAGVTGGQNLASNYTYTLNYLSTPARPSSGPQLSNIFNGLSAGDYSITIQDGYNGCDVTYPFKVLQPSQIIAQLTTVPNSQSCTTNAQSLQLSVSGGFGPYTYDVSASGSFASPTFNSFIVIPNLVPGRYTYYVKDSRGCISIATNEVSIDTLEPLELTIVDSKNTVKCYSDADGYIKVIATGGLRNYSYTLSGVTNSGQVINITNGTGDFTSIAQGTYQVIVTSTNGNPALACTPVPLNFVVTGPSQPFNVTFTTENVKCKQGSDGKIILKISGGTGVIQYILTPSFNGQQAIDIPNPYSADGFEINNLASDIYYLTVKDENGCIALNRQEIRISEPALAVSATVDPLSVIGESCSGDNNGRLVISQIQGGTVNATNWYSVSVTLQGSADNFITLPNGQISYDTATTLAPGVYNVQVRDANSCLWSDIIEILPGDAINPILDWSIACQSNQSVIQLTVTNASDPKGVFPSNTTFEIVGSGIPAQVDNPVFYSSSYPSLINGGNVSVTVVSSTNCIKTGTTTKPIASFYPLAVTLSQSGINTVMAVVTGGSGDYTYSFFADGQQMQSSLQDTFIYYQQYNLIKVIVTDNSGCTVETQKYFPYIPIKVPDVLTPDGNGQNDDWGPDNIDPTVYPRLVTKIYDRYGRLLATLPVGARWNGKYDGKEVPSGDYWYVIKVDSNDGQEFVGHFTLYR